MNGPGNTTQWEERKDGTKETRKAEWRTNAKAEWKEEGASESKRKNRKAAEWRYDDENCKYGGPKEHGPHRQCVQTPSPAVQMCSKCGAMWSKQTNCVHVKSQNNYAILCRCIDCLDPL